jgi:hypothetical protein
MPVIVCLSMAGCERTEQITVYTAPSHESLQTAEFLADEARRHPPPAPPVPTRTIGVIIPKGTQFWFLKLQGNVDAVAAREKDVREFLNSLRFINDEKRDATSETLVWTLPTGWHQLPPTDLRLATLVLDGDPPLEMSVSKLPIQPDLNLTDQILQNINRWRGQLSLAELEKDEMGAQTEKLNLGDSTAYWVNLSGFSAPRPAMQPVPRQRPVADPKAQAEPFEPKYQKPAEWNEAAPTTFAKISLQAVDGNAKVAITVTPARGDRDSNVNRWRGQLKLDQLPSGQLAATAKKVQVGDQTGDLYEISNEGQTILGVIIEDRDQNWFVKLSGDSQLAERERPRFEAFLKSLQLRKGE